MVPCLPTALNTPWTLITFVFIGWMTMAKKTFTLDANDAVVFADGPVNVTNLDPDWQQATDLQEITDTEAGEVLKFSNFNYQGIEIAQDLSGKEHLHLDVWSATDGTIKVGPVSVSTGEHLIEFNVIGGQWNAIDLDMADFRLERI